MLIDRHSPLDGLDAHERAAAGLVIEDDPTWKDGYLAGWYWGLLSGLAGASLVGLGVLGYSLSLGGTA